MILGCAAGKSNTRVAYEVRLTKQTVGKWRTRFLTKRLEVAQVVDPEQQRNKSRVFFGATVRLACGGGERSLTIVGVDEVEPARGRVSWVSPIARALIKAREGDRVTLRTPAGEEPLEILEVRYDPLD